VVSLNNTIYILRDTKLVQCDEFDPSTDRVGCNTLYDVSDQVKHEWMSVYRKLGGYAVWNEVSSRKIESTVRTTTITDILCCVEEWMNTQRDNCVITKWISEFVPCCVLRKCTSLLKNTYKKIKNTFTWIWCPGLPEFTTLMLQINPSVMCVVVGLVRRWKEGLEVCLFHCHSKINVHSPI
jgi:hypothetical protein